MPGIADRGHCFGFRSKVTIRNALMSTPTISSAVRFFSAKMRHPFHIFIALHVSSVVLPSSAALSCSSPGHVRAPVFCEARYSAKVSRRAIRGYPSRHPVLSILGNCSSRRASGTRIRVKPRFLFRPVVNDGAAWPLVTKSGDEALASIVHRKLVVAFDRLRGIRGN